MSLQHGVGFRSLKLIWRGKTFQCPKLPVLIYGYHDGSLATQVNDVMLVEGFGRLCGHDSIVESPVTSGLSRSPHPTSSPRGGGQRHPPTPRSADLAG